MKKNRFIVSACLIGEPCRYDGESKKHPGITRYLRKKDYLTLCPEMLAGWGSPRPSVQFFGGGAVGVVHGKTKIKDCRGRDRTESLLRGVSRALRQALRFGVREAILKDKSPSCGVRRIYMGGRLRRGEGVFTYRLREKGIGVRSEESFGDR
ncbi:MAG: DUF523 domain-containing protein [Candidatus Binatia bacterium]|mgnify:CR=1 FL=1|nr:DUF523 domain-containing protein [Candidatus Binatia bacterium]